MQGLAFAGHGPFARIQWFTLLEQAGAKPLVALARDGDHALALPLSPATTGLEPLTNWYAFTWTDLATPGADRASLLESLARDLASRASKVTLSKLPDEDGTATRLEHAFRRAGWLVLREACDTNHVLPLAGRSYAEYLAARPGALRTTLKRKAKKVEVEVLTSFQGHAWAAYEQVYEASWKPEEGDPALLRRFAEAEGAAGRLRLGLARHEGAVVAAQFWTVEDRTAWIHKLAHLESAKPLSAGTTLSAALFEQVIDRDRVEWVDFGTGDDPYKRDWMEQVRPRWRLTCLRGDPRNWLQLVRSFARKLVSRGRAG
ncbi:MAG: GNAT family N-acetyltransferase [Proteobacteria bacterium]|nr:MAG: GNAT family N-acetyltransferase [Pseudomonadota bacterium]